DCDGSTDENLTHSTSCGVGACASTGTETCTAGVWGGNTCTPGTPSAEVCDNIDNDCDGQTDEGVLITWYADGDSDGYGYLNSSSTQACNAPAGYVANNTDCDDSNPAVNPGVTEISNNGIDDDCNPATPVITASGSGNNYPVTLFRASLSLNVNASSLGTSTFSYYYTRARLYLVSTSITGISVTGGVATITGAGKVNNVTGYTFTATITDSSTDKMGLEIRKSDGTLYYSATSKNLSSGNFTVIGQ
ncbi:MAG: putative metal-binding motif-containing protein, partial [Nitrospirae bacterium]|nr:putative metal-binding motif-containing protein [Nitrospirota bacterium]